MYDILFALFLALLYLFWHQTNYIQVNKIDVKIKDLPDSFYDFTIVHITDLHGKCYGKDQCHLIKMINRYNFDIIVLTGDMFKDNKEIDSMHGLKQIINYVHSKQKAVYFVAGNHDLAGDYDFISRELGRLGVHVLDNKSVKIERKNSFINLIGIKDCLYGMANLDSAIENVNKGIKILLAHTIFKRGDKTLLQSVNELKIDLVLAGHTHGFQINLFPFYMTGEGWFPKYVKGLHKVKNSYIYISRGLGTSGINIRLFSRPELTFICLKAN